MNTAKIIEYELVSADEIPALNDRVNELIEDGWQPLGAATVTTGMTTGGTPWDIYCQTMVKYGKSVNAGPR